MKPWASRSYSLSEREIYSAVSTVLGSQNLAADELGASIVDTAICAKPGELLAGQLLYGDSMHRSYFVRTGSEDRDRDAQTCNFVLPKNLPRFLLPAERV
jgi:hypothetical protein